MPTRFQREGQAEPIPGYKLIERLGAGGFGEVWKAEAPGGLLKAIKFVYGELHGEGGDGIGAEQELKSLSRVKSVRHPYILSLERFDIIDGQLIIVMELADRNLWERFRECKTQGLPGVPREELLGYLEEAAEALDLMNNHYQLQHLDIKPQNLFLVGNHLKVADFGVVKNLEGMVTSVTGGVTAIYAAPELFDGWVSRFSDQYSLAIVYQELLTGQRPFVATNLHQLMMQHVQGKPNVSLLPLGEQPIIARALSKNPEERHFSCMELIRALRLQSEAPAAPAPAEPRPSIVRADPEAPTQPRRAPPAAVDSNGVTVPSRANGAPSPHPVLPHANGREVRTTAEACNGLPAATEVTGDGDLMPAVVVGLGRMGLETLQRFHGVLEDRFGSRSAVPNIRLLYIDTDPEALQEASLGKQGAALLGGEVLAARLNRASHYLTSRKGTPPLDTWLDTTMLYRIQRRRVTGGLRALGRLAFCDHYRAIADRLRSELQACTDAEGLSAACQHTGLKLRTTRPRVYVVTSLTGGTGSGMFIDLAYVVRHLLKELGYSRPEVTGLFLLPAVTDSAARKQALGNTFAALTELSHFSSPEATFSARYEERQAALSDSGAPFHRCVLLPLPNVPGEVPPAGIFNLLSQFLYRDLITPLGRAADAARINGTTAAHADALRCQTFGMFRISWPRRALLQSAARRLCQQLVRRWLGKDSEAVRATIQGTVQEQWAAKELAADIMITRLRTACERALGQPPETAFTAVTDCLVAPADARGSQLDHKAVSEALAKLEEIVGQPLDSAVLSKPGVIEETLRKEAEALVVDCEDKLAKITVPYMEQPGFRLAGAEEAIRQATGLIEKVLQHHEPLLAELSGKADRAYERLQALRPALAEILAGGRKTAPVVAELLELLRHYPKWRYQMLVLRRVQMAYMSLRGYLSDQMREIGFCRTRLTELLQTLEGPPARQGSGEETEGQRYVFPGGAATPEEVVERFLGGVTADGFLELDRRMQEMIQQQFRAFVHVCTGSSHLVKNLEQAMREEAEGFAGARLTGDDVVEMYLSRQPSEKEAVEDLAVAFQEAAPQLARQPTAGPHEICILAVPSSPKRDELHHLLSQAAPRVAVLDVASPGDILLYREQPELAVADLEQLGPLAEEAYQQMNTAEHLTPHARLDVAAWK